MYQKYQFQSQSYVTGVTKTEIGRINGLFNFKSTIGNAYSNVLGPT